MFTKYWSSIAECLAAPGLVQNVKTPCRLLKLLNTQKNNLMGWYFTGQNDHPKTTHTHTHTHTHAHTELFPFFIQMFYCKGIHLKTWQKAEFISVNKHFKSNNSVFSKELLVKEKSAAVDVLDISCVEMQQWDSVEVDLFISCEVSSIDRRVVINQRRGLFLWIFKLM